MLYLIIAIVIVVLLIVADDDMDPRIKKEVQRIINERNDNS